MICPSLPQIEPFQGKKVSLYSVNSMDHSIFSYFYNKVNNSEIFLIFKHKFLIFEISQIKKKQQEKNSGNPQDSCYYCGQRI